MSGTRPAFVFVHGAWHNAATWRQVIPLLEARRFVALALDLPGAGVHAKAPRIVAHDYMVAAVDGVLGGRTRVHSLTASHSPFYSQPKQLADLLAGIAGE